LEEGMDRPRTVVELLWETVPEVEYVVAADMPEWPDVAAVVPERPEQVAINQGFDQDSRGKETIFLSFRLWLVLHW